MPDHNEEELVAPEVEELDDPSSSPIDEVLRNTHERGLSGEEGIDSPPSRSRTSLLGEVIQESSSDFPGRVLVRWLDEEDRTHERWVVCLKGLRLGPGDKVLLSKPDNWSGWVVTGALQQGAPQENVRELDVEELQEAVDIRVDGKRVELEGQDEIVLKCGKASITLRRNGRIVIRGTYVESYSKGNNRIKGGSVQIN